MAEKDQESEWVLGALVRLDRPDLDGKFVPVRNVEYREAEAIRFADYRLRQLHINGLINALRQAFQELDSTLEATSRMTLEEAHSADNLHLIESQFTAALATVFPFRQRLLDHVSSLGIPELIGSEENLEAVYRTSPEYRLVYQLRNLDQHAPSAAQHLSMSTHEQSPGEVRVLINLDSLFDRAISAADGHNYRRRWEECSALWAEEPRRVDARTLMWEGFKVCEAIAACHVLLAQPQMDRDIDLLVNLYLEAVKHGSPAIYNVRAGAREGLFDITMTHIDKMTFGYARASIDAALEVFGRSPRQIPGEHGTAE